MKKKLLSVVLSVVLSLSSVMAVSAGDKNADYNEMIESISQQNDVQAAHQDESQKISESEAQENNEKPQNVPKADIPKVVEESNSAEKPSKEIEEVPEQSMPESEEADKESKEEAILQNEAENGVESTQATQLSAVTNLKAVSAGKNCVKLSWNRVSGAQQYIIYRQIGKGSFSYRYITSNLTYVDTTASGLDYNFYRVYPCYTNGIGKRIVGPSANYVFAKATLEAVGNLKAASYGKNRVKLIWDSVKGVDGYIIYRQVGKSTFSYRYITTNLSYVDTTASDTEYNFYRVYPYYKQDGKNVIGASKMYVYAKGILPAVTGLKAQVIGKTIKITWNKVSAAEGYIIYRQEGKAGFKYLYTKDASATSYIDSKCTGADYNYYRVYPYHKKANKMIPGISNKYVYGNIVLKPVTELTSRSSNYREVTLRWTKPRGAEGYYIVRGIGDAAPEVIGEVKNGNTTKFVDRNASTSEVNCYIVVPFLVDGKGDTIITNAVTSTSAKAINVALSTTRVSISGIESYADAYKVLDRVNAERKKMGAQPLVMDQDLMEAAMQRAAETVVIFSHTRPSGLECYTIEPKVWGENIAAGTYPGYGPNEIMDEWMNSTGHRQNILKNDYKSIGIGCFRYRGGAYWVQLFGYDMIVQAKKPADKNSTRVVDVADNILNAKVRSTELDKETTLDIGKEEIREENSITLQDPAGVFNQILPVLKGKIKKN